jgi:hypothetical protein
MKNPFAAGALILSVFLAAALPARAQVPAALPGPPGELKIVVVEELLRESSGISDYNLIAAVFTDVFQKRKWPYRISVERFASNTPDNETQLRIFYQGIYKETPDAITFHAWMEFYDNGSKKDFGIVRYRYSPHALQLREDVIEHVLRGAANEAADKIEAVLYPKAAKKP